MKKMILKVVLPVFMCAILSSCININSMNKFERGSSLDYTLSQEEDNLCGGSVKTELYFGLLKPDGTTVSEEEWQAFVDKSVCPLFEGFTIIDAFGQSKNTEVKADKRKTKMLIIVQKDGDGDDIGKVKNEFNKAFPGNAFFRVSYPVSSSLDEDEDNDDGKD
jgi:hypothetical protein